MKLHPSDNEILNVKDAHGKRSLPLICNDLEQSAMYKAVSDGELHQFHGNSAGICRFDGEFFPEESRQSPASSQQPGRERLVDFENSTFKIETGNSYQRGSIAGKGSSVNTYHCPQNHGTSFQQSYSSLEPFCVKAPRRSRADFSEKLKDLLSSPDYGDGFGSKLKNRSKRAYTKRRRSHTMEPAVLPMPLCYTGSFCPSSNQFCMQCGCTDYACNTEAVVHSPASIAGDQTGLACALGISLESLRHDKVFGRRKNIQTKLKLHANPVFTLEEEYDVHCRAEAYASHVLPDPEYNIPGGSLPPTEVTRDDTDSTNNSSCGKDQELAYSHAPKKRRRQLSVMKDYIMVGSSNARECHDLSASCVTLADGTKLLKPALKLVELVAQAINDSPDGLLQVQQVYNALQQRYPFFQYLDKTSVTSWRSSIRHALYQKWFMKVQFSTELINTRGCYWAINRRHHPKEWSLPPDKHDLDEADKCEEDTELLSGDLSLSLSPFLAEAVDDIIQENLLGDVKLEIEDPSHNVPLLDLADFDGNEPLSSSSSHNVSLSVFSPKDSGLTKDALSDPMLHSLHESQQEVDVLDKESTSSSLLSSSSSLLTEPPLDISDWLKEASIASSSYYGEISPWIPTFDDAGSPCQAVPQSSRGLDQLNDHTPPRYLSVVPPDIEKLRPHELEVCMMQRLPYNEHW